MGYWFMAMFHMANDSNLFKTKIELEQQGFVRDSNRFARGAEFYLPLYEAKMMYLYSHRHGDFGDAVEGGGVLVLRAGDFITPGDHRHALRENECSE